MNWRWSLVAIVVALSLARWAVEATRLGQQMAREEASAEAAAPPQAAPQFREYPAGDGRLPDHYPADVPFFEQAEIAETVVVPRPERVTWNVVFRAETEPGELETWYKAELESRGWKVTRLESLPAAQQTGEPGRVLVAMKEGRRFELLWGENGGDWHRTVTQMLVEPVRRSNPNAR